MVWFNVDDGLSTSPKVLGIPREQRLAAIGLWTLAGSWCSKHLTDGAIPGFMIEEWGADEALAGNLVRAGLWRETRSGFRFHEWETYQRTKSDIEHLREQERTRKAAYRAKKAGHSPDGPDDRPAGRDAGRDAGIREASEHPIQSIPSQAIRTLSSDRKRSTEAESTPEEFSPDVHRLSSLLAELITANGNRVGLVGVTWWRACERMIRIDGRTPEQIEWLIRWSQRDNFWTANIRSMSKLREQFDQLKARALSDRDKGVGQFARNLAIVEEYREAGS